MRSNHVIMLRFFSIKQDIFSRLTKLVCMAHLSVGVIENQQCPNLFFHCWFEFPSVTWFHKFIQTPTNTLHGMVKNCMATKHAHLCWLTHLTTHNTRLPTATCWQKICLILTKTENEQSSFYIASGKTQLCRTARAFCEEEENASDINLLDSFIGTVCIF